MERLANYILSIYPIGNVPFKRRVTLHTIFWAFFFISVFFISGLPSDSIFIHFIQATAYTIICSVFFYVFTYFIPYLYSKYTGWLQVFVISLTITGFFFFMASETYARVILVIENHWITAKIADFMIYIIIHINPDFGVIFS